MAGVAVKVTTVPAHTLLPLALTLMPAGETALTVRFKVAALSQPDGKVICAVCEPAAVNVNPFHTYGKSLVQTERLVVDVTVPQALLIVMVYVFIVVPSCAVTTMLIELLPRLSGILAEATPLTVATPFTFSEAVASARTEVTVVCNTVLPTLIV